MERDLVRPRERTFNIPKDASGPFLFSESAVQ
jgi:hypothetical protein